MSMMLDPINTAMIYRDLRDAFDESERLQHENDTLRRQLDAARTLIDDLINRQRPAAPRQWWGRRGGSPAFLEGIRRLESPGRVELRPGVTVESETWRVIHLGAVIQFAPTEWLLFHALLINRGALVPAEELRELLIRFSPHITSPDHMVRVYISRLRSKLRPAGVAHLVTTVPWSGYRLEVAS